MPDTTLVKICGLTSEEDARIINLYRPDYVGMVLFFPKSKRNITISESTAIRDVLSPDIKTVAVMVSPSPEQALAAEAAGFDILQLHGEISDEVLQKTKAPLWKAFNLHDMSSWSRFHEHSRICGYVFDAAQPGSGQAYDWSLLNDIPRDKRLFFLAGGLSAANAAEAISLVHPDGLDISSGVEYDPSTGIKGKDPEKVKAFMDAVRNTHLSR